MTRARSIGAVVAGALAWAAVTACNQQVIQTPIRVFDRPSDVALVCAQFNPNEHALGTYNVRPLADCNPNVVTSEQLTNDAQHPLPPNFLAGLGMNPPFMPFVMALVTQSARGELALVDTQQNKVVDLDPLTPSFGFLPVGSMPEHVRVSHDGCDAVTANTDSCDFGLVDVPKMINQSQTSVSDMGVPNGNSVRRVRLATPAASGGGVGHELFARPVWVEMSPDEVDATADNGACTGGTHRMWAALPACQLVVKARLPDPSTDTNAPGSHDAIIEAAVRVTRTGTEVITDPAELAALDCPVECAGVPGGSDNPDGLVPPPPATPSDMGGLPLPNTQAAPGTLAVDRDGGRLVIGDLYGERIDIVPIDKTGGLGTPRHVQLEAGAGGVSVVRISPRSFAGQFLYAIARDGSVRVVDLDREVECETNPDPRYVGNGINLQQTPFDNPPLPADPTPQARQLGCFPLGDPATPPRAPLATSPGIQLTPGQLPKDIAFIHVDQPPPSTDPSIAPTAASPGLLVGDFAWIISSDGRGTVVNIFDACPQPNQQDVLNTAGPYTPVCSLANVPKSNQQTAVQFGHPEALLLDRLSHRIRFGTPRFAKALSESDTTGAPRVTSAVQPCTTTLPSTTNTPVDGGVAAQGRCDTGALPGLLPEQLPAPLIDQTVPGAIDTFPTRVVRFVNPDKVGNEAWTAIWEGTLPGTDRPLGDPVIAADGKPYLLDSGGAWCSHGVQANDKLFLRGCTVDTECDQAGHFQCVHDPGAPPDVSQGMCLPVDDGDPTHTVNGWVSQCGLMLRALRKYRITSAKQGVEGPMVTGSDGTTAPTGVTDVLALAPIYEPEFPEETHECATLGDKMGCMDVTVPNAVSTEPALATECMQDWDGKNRCLLACDPTAMGTTCGTDFECVPQDPNDKTKGRCMRAPIDKNLWTSCMPEVQNYEIHAGDSFLVEGTVSSIPNALAPDPVTRECSVPPETPSTAEGIRLKQPRVPLSGAPACPPGLGALDSIPIGTLASNVCQYPDTRFGSRVVHYENPLFNIAVTVPISPATGHVIVPPDDTTITMTITGGSVPLSSPLGVDVQAQLPRYVTVAPDQQTVYIVDEGKSISAAGLRGQLLRLYSPTQSVDAIFIIR